jgi:hypothetical protein
MSHGRLLQHVPLGVQWFEIMFCSCTCIATYSPLMFIPERTLWSPCRIFVKNTWQHAALKPIQ